MIEGGGTLTLDIGAARARRSRSTASWSGRASSCPEEERRLGPTPVGPVDLEMGSYLAVLSAPGFRDVRYPVHISRNRDWKGTVRMRTDEEIGEGFVYVPGGPFVYGEGKETREIELPDFAIAQYPVTFGEYGEFLDALPEEEAEERMPRTQDATGPYMEKGEDGRYRPLARMIVEEPHASAYREEHGEGFEVRIPVMGVTFDDAEAYCAWKTTETGRGVAPADGGGAGEGGAGRGRPALPLGRPRGREPRRSAGTPGTRTPQPEPVGTFPTAASVYGMGDAAGNVWDWTDSWFDERRSLRVLRGGSWSSPSAHLRCWVRNTIAPWHRGLTFGFRCARSLP